MTLARRIIATGAAAAACAAALLAAADFSSDSDSASPGPVTVADGRPGYVVEDFAYPGADKIKAEKGITLKRGDGHITLAGCSSATGLMEVWSRKSEKICFRTTGTSGYLAVEIPSVFAVKGAADHAAGVSLTAADSTHQEIEVGKGNWTSVGESADPQSRDFVLLEIRTRK
ncbi:hypothetical protein [Streptomyces hiroshimensis]|uniref:Secreted protein n=1 Tax=Streptomyces hiroshimensis TaxID=66424 RepID=A0ABQ2Z6Z7_9ACTN|nr:hypothetical protein [Streptomyces hiroshimensis]GGY06613.1 hypothetical protein GCM10010324_61740 [Streptomyces hiroshimensis]